MDQDNHVSLLSLAGRLNFITAKPSIGTSHKFNRLRGSLNVFINFQKLSWMQKG
jgi:hypothetical protein